MLNNKCYSSYFLLNSFFHHTCRKEFHIRRRFRIGGDHCHRPTIRTSCGDWRRCLISTGANDRSLGAWLPSSRVTSDSGCKRFVGEKSRAFCRPSCASTSSVFFEVVAVLQPWPRVLQCRNIWHTARTRWAVYRANQRNFPFEKRCPTRFKIDGCVKILFEISNFRRNTGHNSQCKCYLYFFLIVWSKR